METYKAIQIADLTVAVGEFVSLASWGLGNTGGEVGLISVVGGALYIYFRGGTVVRTPIKSDGTGLGAPQPGTTDRRR